MGAAYVAPFHMEEIMGRKTRYSEYAKEMQEIKGQKENDKPKTSIKNKLENLKKRQASKA